MKTTYLWLFFCLIPPLISGCATVSSKHRLGEPASAEQTGQLEGIWLTADGGPTLFKHVKDNEIRIGWIEWEEGRFVVEELTAYVTNDDEQQYVNLVDHDAEDSAKQYTFARLSGPEDELLFVNLANTDTFENAVGDAQLAGIIEKNMLGKTSHIAITASKAELDEFVSPDKVGEQFDFDPIMALRRVRTLEEEETVE